jgi:hypothetical protein
MNDRDKFAAAALTGWLASQQTVLSARAMASHAYEYADAILAARGTTTDLDAAPAAVPAEPAAGEVHEARAPSGTGDTRAWRRSGNYHRLVGAAVRYSRSDSGPRAGECMDRLCDVVDEIVGIYAAPPAAGPTLTDAERELLTHVRDIYYANRNIPHCARIAFTIAGLLARAAKEER